MTTVSAVVKLTVDLYVDVADIRSAEHLLDHWLRDAEEDERLRSYIVRKGDWVPDPENPKRL